MKRDIRGNSLITSNSLAHHPRSCLPCSFLDYIIFPFAPYFCLCQDLQVDSQSTAQPLWVIQDK